MMFRVESKCTWIGKCPLLNTLDDGHGGERGSIISFLKVGGGIIYRRLQRVFEVTGNR